MILEHAPFGRRGFFASFTPQGVQGGQILAAAVFLPLAHYMPEQFNSWGWRILFLLSFVVIIAGWIIRREVEEIASPSPTSPRRSSARRCPSSTPSSTARPHYAARGVHGADERDPAWPPSRRLRGAPADGIGFAKDIYLWIPVLVLAVLVIPYVGTLSGWRSAAACPSSSARCLACWPSATCTPSASVRAARRPACRC